MLRGSVFFEFVYEYHPNGKRKCATVTNAAGRGSIVGRVLLERKFVQIPDVLDDPEYTLHELQRRGSFRTILGVPLLREDDQIGIIVLMRNVVQPFRGNEQFCSVHS